MAGLAGMGSRPLALMRRQLTLAVLSSAVLVSFVLASDAREWLPDFNHAGVRSACDNVRRQRSGGTMPVIHGSERQ
jgi:hypothetical protein